MKRLVVCCDGTWNTPDQKDRGVMRPTNVVKLARWVLPQGGDGTVQPTWRRAPRRAASPWIRAGARSSTRTVTRAERDPARYEPANLRAYLSSTDSSIDVFEP